jgi:hypothetical protein
MALAGALAIALGACSSTPAAPAEEQVVTYCADYPFYGSADALFAKADLVVRATVSTQPGRVRRLMPTVSGTNPKLNPQAGLASPRTPTIADSVVITVYQATVADVYKGAATAGQTIEVQQMGGTLHGVTYEVCDAHPLAGGNSYILLLQTYPDSPAALLNPLQGQYPLDATGQPGQLADNPVAITVADLERLSG